MNEKLPQTVVFDNDTYYLNMNEDGTYKYICEKDRFGFKISFTPSNDEIKYQIADEAIERFIINCIL